MADVTLQLRVRVHPLGDDGQIMARIEAGNQLWNRLANPDERERIVLEFKKIGFVFVTIDCAGFESGSMHKLIPKD
jgi:PP-loop superfamily ATP-utilizing enzyme